MSFARPTLEELITRITTDLNSRLGGTGLRRSVNDVLGRVLAGAIHMLHGHLDYISRQVILDTAESEFLDRWAAIWNVTRKPATFAQGNVIFAGTVGSSLPLGSVLINNEGIEYETTESRTFSSAMEDIPVIALSSGTSGNLDEGFNLVLRTPVAGIESSAMAAPGGIKGGESKEPDIRLQERTLSVIQNPPQGGSINDYIQNASSIEGVGRVFVTPLIQGAGTVGVSFLTNDPDNLIPNTQKVEEVQNFLDERKPVTATVFVFAPVPVELDVTISNLRPDTPEVRDAVKNEIADLILREAEPGGTILISHIREAVSIATGENDHVIDTPSGNVSTSLNEIFVPGEVTFA